MDETDYDIRQAIVMRKDLKMRKGKLVAQGAHASMKVLLEQMFRGPEEGKYTLRADDITQKWLDGLFTKIVFGVDSLEELMAVYDAAKKAGIQCALIEDSGKTEFKEPTITCISIGPAHREKLDPITGNLKLL